MNENDKTVVHSEMTVGEILRNARTTGRRKREIPTVSKQLCIREEFLQALEDGNYKLIPETVYILGFARNYAMELGLDPDEIVNKLKREMGLVAEDEDVGADVGTDDNVVADGEKWYQRIWTRSVKFIRRHWVWFVSGVVILLALIGGITFWAMSGRTSGVTPETPTEITLTAPIDVDAEPKYNADVRERFGTENAENASVVLQAIQESWVKVEDARGNTIFSRVLVPGDVYYVPGGDGYTAVFGNAGGVDVWVNGVLAPKQGAEHARVADISLNPDDLM